MRQKRLNYNEACSSCRLASQCKRMQKAAPGLKFNSAFCSYVIPAILAIAAFGVAYGITANMGFSIACAIFVVIPYNKVINYLREKASATTEWGCPQFDEVIQTGR